MILIRFFHSATLNPWWKLPGQNEDVCFWLERLGFFMGSLCILGSGLRSDMLLRG